MQKKEYCTHCLSAITVVYVCDECGEKLYIPTLELSIDSSEPYHFCDYKCLLSFIRKELRKDHIRPIITGKGDTNE